MERPATIFILFGVFLILGVSMTGCSDSTDSAASGTPEDITAPTTAVTLFSAGDIVRSASGSESPAWMVLSYDPAGDTYTRALIYKNADGSYGYRTGTATDIVKREVMEKVYTVKIAQVTVESVPTAAPAAATTEVTITTSRTTTTATTATATTSSAKPGIKSMDPEEGEAGTTVSVELTGNDFLSNMTALLRRSGEDSIMATRVSRASSSRVTCTFDIPNTTKVGTWDFVVTNPNGQSGELANYFMVRGNATED